MDNYSENRKASLVKVHLFGIFWPSDNNSRQQCRTGRGKKKEKDDKAEIRN